MYKLRRTSAGLALRTAFALASLTPLSAAAQQRDPAAAQALFDQARELSKQGHYAEACPKLAESNRLDPGIGTQFHLAECYEQLGQVATAWATFLEVASVARASDQLDREKAATKRASLLEPRLPKLTINMPESSQLRGLEIHRDGVLVGAVQWGTPVPVDPGEHELTVSAPGHQAVTKKLKLEEGKALSFEVPALDSDSDESNTESRAEGEAPPPAPMVAPVTHTHHHKKAPDATPEAKSNVDAWPLALAGAGVVGLAVGGAFALKAMSLDSQSKADCDSPNTNVCGPTGISLRNDALTKGDIATVGIVSGTVLLMAAGLVWDMEARSSKSAALAPVRLRASAAITPGNAALYLQGGF